MEQRVYAYEAMFLVSQQVAADLAGAVAHIKELLSRAGAELLAMRKWDDRRLAYEIKKQKRGVFILTYFKAPNAKMGQLERDCNLSEKIVRVLLLRADHLTEDEMRAADAQAELELEAKWRAEQAAKAPPAPQQEAQPVPTGAPEA